MKEDRIIKSNVFRKECVEGLIGECIGQSKHSLDISADASQTPEGVTRIGSVQATFLVATNEASNVVTMLENYSDAALCPKHRYSRYILKSFVRRMTHIGEGLLGAKRMNKKEVLSFAVHITDFLTALHIVMFQHTNTIVRVSTNEEYCGTEDLNSYGAKIGQTTITIH